MLWMKLLTIWFLVDALAIVAMVSVKGKTGENIKRRED